MMKPPVPSNESERLAALRSYEVLDTPPEEAFDDLARLAAHICGTPVALVSLVDEARQWFKARVGVEEEETDRSLAFCAHGILEGDVLIVPDATKDARFADNPLVTGKQGIRFYAGAPLITAGGHALGTVCVIGQQPRILTQSQIDALRLLARQAVAQLELRKRSRELQIEILERKRIADERDKFFSTSLDLLCVCGGDGFFRRVNPAFERILGWTSDELLPKPFSDIVHPDDQAAVQEQVQWLLAGHGVVEFVVRCRAKDGSYRHIEWTSTAADEAGLFMSCGRDITERKRTEEKLRLSEERFRHAFDDAPIGMGLVSPEGRWLRVNHALSNMLGYAEGELLATDFQHITHPDDLVKDLELVRQMLAGTIPSYQMEKRYLHKNGGVVFVMLSVSLVNDADGAPLYFVSQIENITERRETERALRVSEERLRLVVDGVKDYALLMLDPDGFVVSWSAGAERINGYLADEIVGLHFACFYPPEAVAASRPQEVLRIAARDGRYEEKGWRVRMDGSRFWASVVITAIREPDGKLRGFAKVTRDITESQQQEEQLELQTQRLSLATRTAGIGVWDWDIHNNKITWDETMYKMYRTSRDVPINYEHWKNAVWREDLAEAEATLQQVINEKGRGEMEFRIQRPDKSIRHIQAAMGVTLDKDQNVTRVVGVNLDVTERTQHEEGREKIIAELQLVLMQVKTLSGLIPICGWCKSVRSDTGYWQSVEQYVRANTSANFSHGICPACAANFKDEISLANTVPKDPPGGK
ncbi:MAG: domain S-box [Pedosphaera sp.]|nr:domain S-box [Pedosphaera sp.]